MYVCVYYVIVNAWVCTRYGKYPLGIILWSLRNYDSAIGTSPLRRYHSSWGIFLVSRTCPYLTEFITEGNRKMNTDWDADGLLSSTLPLTRSDSSLFSNLSTKYEMGKPWDKCQWTAHLNRLVSNSLQQRPIQEPHRHFTHVRMFYECNCPCYERDHPCYEHHTPVTSVMPLLRAWPLVCRVVTQNSTCAVPFILRLPK